jgi:hypothetical protein
VKREFRKPLDYEICVYGVVCSLLFSGLFGQVTSTILFFAGLFSLGLALISGITLIGRAIMSFSPFADYRILLVQLVCNLLPSVSFVLGYSAKVQLPTAPGCC